MRVDAVSLPSFHAVRQGLAAIKRIDRRHADIEFLKRRLEPIVKGYVLSTPVLMPGQRLFRGVLWVEQPSLVAHLSYPPAERVTELQRANRPGDPRFYASVAAAAPIYELRANVGDHVALSEWHVREKLWVLNVGYHSQVLEHIGSNREKPPHWQEAQIPGENPGNRYLHKFLAEEFARDVPSGSEDMYRMSVAIAEKLVGKVQFGQQNENMPTDNRFAGLLYPGMAMRGDTDNVALHPEFVDRYLDIKTVRYVRVDSKSNNAAYQLTTVDFADTFRDGAIKWQSRGPDWPRESERTMRIAIEEGHWTMRNSQGQVYDRH